MNSRSRSLSISKTIWLFSMLCKKRCRHREHPHFPLFFHYTSSLSSTLKKQSNSSRVFHMPWTHPSRSLMSIWHNHGSHAFMHLRLVCIFLSFRPQTCLLTKLPVLNPTLKFEWIEQHWKADEARAARGWIRDSVQTLLFFTQTTINPLC